MSLKKITEEICSLNNVLILTHKRPDGDALGSTFALLKYYQENSKNALVFFPEEIPSKYKQYLPDYGVCYNLTFDILLKAECVISLDCSDEERLGISEDLKEDIFKKKILNIDHHFDNSRFGTVNFINPKACAAGEIIFDILQIINEYKISAEVAKYILLAMITDTGGLRFDNTTSAVFAKTSKLVEYGADYLSIVKDMFSKKPYSLHLLESDIALNHLGWNFDNKFVYTYLSDEIMSKYNTSIKDIEGVIDSYRVLDSVIIAALITHRGKGFKISLRSNYESYPVVDIAHEIGGGGHKMAAGCFVETEDINIVINKLHKLVGKVLNYRC